MKNKKEEKRMVSFPSLVRGGLKNLLAQGSSHISQCTRCA
jgi:hypothetical protein